MASGISFRKTLALPTLFHVGSASLMKFGKGRSLDKFKCELRYLIRAVMSSYPGTIITIIATAYLTYRWYRARHQEVA